MLSTVGNRFFMAGSGQTPRDYATAAGPRTDLAGPLARAG
jgi:hypothetical protein